MSLPALGLNNVEIQHILPNVAEMSLRSFVFSDTSAVNKINYYSNPLYFSNVKAACCEAVTRHSSVQTAVHTLTCSQ